MSATNKTTNYELPLFVDDDQPTWLGDFNGAMNKIDADLGQVASNATKALNTSTQALSLAKTNEQDIAIVDAQLAGTSDSGLKTLIELETTRAKDAERELKAKATYSSDTTYLGNINLTENNAEYLNPQGACTIDDTVYAVSTTGTAANDKCRVFKISLASGNIMGQYDVNWGHCNSISYCPADGYIYVCPTATYASGSAVPVSKFYKVNPTTMEIVDTVTMDVVPHSMYTDKVSGDMYLVAETKTPAYKLDLYRFNRVDNSVQLMGTIPTNLVGTLHMIVNTTYGTQTIKAWNGHLFFVLGGNGFNGLIELDEKCDIVGVKNVPQGMGAFLGWELQDADFDANGDLVCWSAAHPRCSYRVNCGLLFGMNVFGNKIADTDIAANADSNIYAIHLDPAANPNCVRELGTKEYPYKTFANAVSKAFTMHSPILIEGDCSTDTYIATLGDLNLRIARDKTLTMNYGYDRGNVYIEPASSGSSATVAMSAALYASQTYLKNLVVTGSTTINGGVLQLQGVKGGTFNGGGSAVLVKNSATTSTCSNFVVPSVS